MSDKVTFEHLEQLVAHLATVLCTYAQIPLRETSDALVTLSAIPP